MRRVNTTAEIYKGDVDPDDWVVACVEPGGGDNRFMTIFSGPYAEDRAFEYAEAKYAHVERRMRQCVLIKERSAA